MLTLEQYNNLWTTPAPNGFGQTHAIPSYDEYVIRENQYQDYLDIFRGYNTRMDRNIRPIVPPNWYYEHPFFNEQNEPKYQGIINSIRYIMIGEAAPGLDPVNPHENNENTYFYNILHLGNTDYFTAPCNAFGITGENKAEKLFKLALQGVLLIDLFPFAVNYSKPHFRSYLCEIGITRFFWDGNANPYSLIRRINEIRVGNLLNYEGVKLAFIAPPKISYYIANGINANWPNFGYNYREGHNSFDPPFNKIRGKFYNGIPINSSLIGENRNYNLPNADRGHRCINVPIFACCCYSGSNLVPHQLFIRNAFGLPENNQP